QGGDGVTGFAPAPDGTNPVVTLTDANGAISNISSNTSASTGTVNVTCSVTYTTNTAGTVTGHAKVTFSVGGGSLTRETDNTHGTTGDAVKRFVDAKISIAPDATFVVGESHQFAVHFLPTRRSSDVQGGDGVTGFGPAPDGTNPVVTLTDANGA